LELIVNKETKLAHSGMSKFYVDIKAYGYPEIVHAIGKQIWDSIPNY